MVHGMDEACSTHKVLPVHAIKEYGMSKYIYIYIYIQVELYLNLGTRLR